MLPAACHVRRGADVDFFRDWDGDVHESSTLTITNVGSTAETFNCEHHPRSPLGL